jgi:hypothetical protein
MAAHHREVPQPVFHEPIFGETGNAPDPTGFETDHPSDNDVYRKIEDLLKKEVVPVPKSRLADHDIYTLEQAYGAHGAQVVEKIRANTKIVFHALGDSGASNSGKYGNELRVADQVTLDARDSDEWNRPAFLFHLGDVVYDFGESRYYYDQFYEPFRGYPAPIFAIPGNHDSFIVPGTAKADVPLTTFMRNFCSEAPVITPEAASLHRTAMTQPGVYFTLDAPFVRIIGLFSNALEDPGVISRDGGKWPEVSDIQLDFLRAQLKRIKDEQYDGAVLLATHHPPYSYAPPPSAGSAGGYHGCSSAMLKQIDTICLEEGVYPHAVMSGHAHNYQRYTRVIKFAGRNLDVPFIVCGDGGHNVNRLVQGRKGHPAQEPNPGVDVKYLEWEKAAITAEQLILEKYDDRDYGYLRVHVDKDYLKIAFHKTTEGSLAQSRYDMVTVNLHERAMEAN